MSHGCIKVEPSKMSTRGQIVIPREIRKKMGLKKDVLFMVASIDKDTLVFKRVDKDKLMKEFLDLRGKLLERTGGLTPGEIEEEIEHARKRN